MRNFDLVINGVHHPVAQRFEVLNPATGTVAGTAPNAGLAELDLAVAAAKAAFPAGWSCIAGRWAWWDRSRRGIFR